MKAGNKVKIQFNDSAKTVINAVVHTVSEETFSVKVNNYYLHYRKDTGEQCYVKNPNSKIID